jgi:hypothetical protein
MEAESTSNGRASSNNSCRLQRRLMALPRQQWTLDADHELTAHISTMTSLSDVAQLSDCLTKMAEHMASLAAHEQLELLDGLLATPALHTLYAVTGSALQQLGQGLQQYLQQGQLPAALTVYAVEACKALCHVLSTIHKYALAQPSAQQQMKLRHTFSTVMCSTGKGNSQADQGRG